MKLLFLFLDGIGLGENDPEINPFARADMPTLKSLLGGRTLTRHSVPYEGERATLVAADASLGVDGLPQSATGQAVLLTGENIPARIGYHYGPKPDPATASHLVQTIFSILKQAGKSAALLNAYPPRFFDGIDSGKRLYSSIPLAVTNAGYPLFTKKDYYAGSALSADFTGAGWHSFLGLTDAPLMQERIAGHKLESLARQYDFSLFEYWASDYTGHKQDMTAAVNLLESFDKVLDGLLEKWEDEQGLILLTSDHGNMEDLSTRKHTANAVPVLVMGKLAARKGFTYELKDLTGIAPRILETIA
jgi:2,3-bisphosphoglycerate-independent phosphoglycerate mutase